MSGWLCLSKQSPLTLNAVQLLLGGCWLCETAQPHSTHAPGELTPMHSLHRYPSGSVPGDLGFSVSASGNGEELQLVDTHIDPWADEWPACDLDGEQVFVDWSWDPARDMAVQVDCGDEVPPTTAVVQQHSRTLSWRSRWTAAMRCPHQLWCNNTPSMHTLSWRSRWTAAMRCPTTAVVQ